MKQHCVIHEGCFFHSGVDFSIHLSTHHSPPWQTFGHGRLWQQPPERNELLHAHESNLPYSRWQQLWTWDSEKKIVATLLQWASVIQIKTSSWCHMLTLKVQLCQGNCHRKQSGSCWICCLCFQCGKETKLSPQYRMDWGDKSSDNWYSPVTHLIGQKHSLASKSRRNHWFCCMWIKVAVLKMPTSIARNQLSFFFLSRSGLSLILLHYPLSICRIPFPFHSLFSQYHCRISPP